MTETWPSIDLVDIKPYPNNSRTHTQAQIDQVAASMGEFGFTNPIIIDEDDNLLAGHCRLSAAHQLGIDAVPYMRLFGLSAAQKQAYIIADNNLALNADWDFDILQAELRLLDEQDFNLNLIGFDPNELQRLLSSGDIRDEVYPDGESGKMGKDFGFSPFTVLNSRDGNWQKRKQYWLNQGIKSSAGRDQELQNYHPGVSMTGGQDTSIFDPVLCELLYHWFTPKGGTVLDPFAGGSIRGILASKCGRGYIGNDLSLKQVEENRVQANSICFDEDIKPVWTNGDSLDIKKLVGNLDSRPLADSMLSCPPYVDLEVYSDDPKDLSTMAYDVFLDTYRKIIADCFDLLKEDSFAMWVVGEVRDKKGNYHNFVGDTITAFIDAGFNYYNEAILINMIGSLPIRAGATMRATRKLGKCHQNVLVFVKGDGKTAAQRCGEIEINIDVEVEEENLYGEEM